MNTPLLLITWRRPHTLRQVIDAIRPVAPTRLYVACDGPNPDRPGEAEKVEATRALIELAIDWPCAIERLYFGTNQGCRLGVSRAITWFFEQVEEGIILEDDCVPHPDFFIYCTNLLEYYRNDTRVWSICGSNFQSDKIASKATYYFSIHGDSWGWATWKRAWRHYSEAEQNWPVFRDSGCLSDIFLNIYEQAYWRFTLDRLFDEGKPSSWAYQWFLTSYMNNGLHIWPNCALIRNVGYGDDATHTKVSEFFMGQPFSPLSEIVHPLFILPNRCADEHLFMHRRGGGRLIKDWLRRKKYGFFYLFIISIRRIIGARKPWRLLKLFHQPS